MRTIHFYLYFFGYLFYTLTKLKKTQEIEKSALDVAEKDLEIHKIPKHWAGRLVKISGATVTVTGTENIPSGPVLFVSNHEGNFDIPILLSYIKKPFGFISKVEVKKIPVVAKWMELMSCVFMDRKDRRQSIKAIREGIDVLKNGHSILVFPEGTRSKGGAIKEFKSGSLRLAKDSLVPIVPIFIDGSSDIMEKNGGWIKPAPVAITVLKPITSVEYQGRDLKEVTAEIQQLIASHKK